MSLFMIGSRRAVPAAKLIEKLLSCSTIRSAASAGRYFMTDADNGLSHDVNCHGGTDDFSSSTTGSAASARQSLLSDDEWSRRHEGIDDILLTYISSTSSRLSAEKEKPKWWDYNQKSRKQSKW